jgi:hypothetical protein
MSYITYGVKVVCISNRGEETQEFLSELIDPNFGLSDELKDNELWIDNAGELLCGLIDDGDLEECDDIEGAWTFVVKYGAFRVEIAGTRLAVA